MAYIASILGLFPFYAHVFLVFCVAFLLAHLFINRLRDFPPSPGGGLPLIGHLLSLGTKPHLKLTEWRGGYGDVFSIRMGMERVVVLNGYRVIREALVDCRDVFSSRPDLYLPNAISGCGKDIVIAKWGQPYRERRRFASSVLKTLGMKEGTGSAEDIIRQEARKLCSKISAKDSQPFDVVSDLNNAVSNVICALVFGQQFGYDDETFRALREGVLQGAARVSTAQAFNVFPSLRFVPGLNKACKEVLADIRKVEGFICEQIEEHRQRLDPDNPQDFLDMCLLEVRGHGRVEGLTEENVMYIVSNLFLAGTETTTTTLRWALLYMILHPHIQQRVQEELESVVGKSGDPPTLAQRSRLPYAEAVLMETQRIRHITPLSIPHATAVDTVFRGYRIPAGTQVVPNMWSAHMDPEFWPDPEGFDPRRHLDWEGNLIKNPESFMPFSVGRRMCLGERLAKMELFLFFTAMLQQFSFVLPEGAATPSTDGVFGITMSPQPYELRAIDRS
ncbi:cytochrome P450 2U1-like [Branchiostoma floridae x Branchiostoma japonicum]